MPLDQTLILSLTLNVTRARRPTTFREVTSPCGRPATTTLLPAAGGETLLQAAVRRGRAVAENVVIVTGASQADATREVVPDVELIVEPIGRNTAPALGLAAAT